MKLIHVKQARAVWLFDLQDLNPRGKSVLEDVREWIEQRYGFAVAPEVENLPAAPNQTPTAQEAAVPASKLVFQRGRFQAHEDVFVDISSLEIYNDGIVVDTASSTQDGDQFIADLLESAAREFGLTYDSEMVSKRMYVSTLIVRSDVSLETVHPGLADFAEKIAESMDDGPTLAFKFAGLQFWTEPNDSGIHRIFSLLPQAGKSFSEHRYFSEAPLKTEDHFRLLEELEQVLTKH